MALQVGREAHLRAEVAVHLRHVAHDQPAGVHGCRLFVLRVGADVADVRIGQRDVLAAVARVGEDFLVAGERCVEHHLAGARRGCAHRSASKDGAVSKCEQGRGVAGQQGQGQSSRGQCDEGDRKRTVDAQGASMRFLENPWMLRHPRQRSAEREL
jgi:hypothetical protein